MNSYTQQLQFGELIDALIESRKLIAWITITLTLIGLIYIVVAQPLYQADALVKIETKAKSIDALTELSGLFEEEAVNAELQLLTSRSVLGRVVANLNLDIIARPKRFPVLGTAVSRVAPIRDKISTMGTFFEEYAWGSEEIEVDIFELPTELEGSEFGLVTDKTGYYKLLDKDGDVIGRGSVGELFEAYISGEEVIKLFVSKLKAKPGTNFEIKKIQRLAAIERLKNDLKIKEQGLQSGVLQISLMGPNRKKITAVINEVANIYVRQSVERISADAENALGELDEQLPLVKQGLDEDVAALNRYRLQVGSVDLTLETRALLEKTVALEAQLSELASQREELLQRFTVEHPRVETLDVQIASTKQQLSQTRQQVRELPDTEQKILRLSRDVEVATSLYTSLLNKAQELKVIRAGTSGNVHIVDYALLPYKPVKPKKGLTVSLCFVLGLLIGGMVSVIRHNLRYGVQDPDVIEKRVGLPVYATVPMSRRQRNVHTGFDRGGKQEILATFDQDDPAIESLRSLRTSLHFMVKDAINNLVLITGPGADVGKTFVSINLSAVLAKSGKSVLLVDTDFRKRSVSKTLGLNDVQGLSDLIHGEKNLQEVVQQSFVDNLDVLACGSKNGHATEMLLNERFERILKQAEGMYDYIIIDSAPVLAVSDAAIIGRLAGVKLLVVGAKDSSFSEIEQSVKRLKQVGVELNGVVLNSVQASGRRYGYSKKYYGYGYSRKG